MQSYRELLDKLELEKCEKLISTIPSNKTLGRERLSVLRIQYSQRNVRMFRKAVDDMYHSGTTSYWPIYCENFASAFGAEHARAYMRNNIRTDHQRRVYLEMMGVDEAYIHRLYCRRERCFSPENHSGSGEVLAEVPLPEMTELVRSSDKVRKLLKKEPRLVLCTKRDSALLCYKAGFFDYAKAYEWFKATRTPACQVVGMDGLSTSVRRKIVKECGWSRTYLRKVIEEKRLLDCADIILSYSLDDLCACMEDYFEYVRALAPPARVPRAKLAKLASRILSGEHIVSDIWFSESLELGRLLGSYVRPGRGAMNRYLQPHKRRREEHGQRDNKKSRNK